MNSLSVEADTSTGTTLLGKAASDLQTDIAIDDDYKVTGTLKYVDDYTGFSGDPAEQVGNFIALDFSADDGCTIEIELTNGAHPGWKALDDDGILVCRITDKDEQKIHVRAYNPETETTSEITLDLSGLTLATE